MIESIHHLKTDTKYRLHIDALFPQEDGSIPDTDEWETVTFPARFIGLADTVGGNVFAVIEYEKITESGTTLTLVSEEDLNTWRWLEVAA